ncbi:MAG TPA: cell division protein ZapA [Usitatibacter sp.]|nr:cell division protein ZapA [Usitatibacter sp.]
MSAVQKSEKGALTLNLLGREFRVACPEGEEKALIASADYLATRIKEIRDTGKVSGNERIAIMAALNIAHELMSNRDNGSPASFDGADFRRRIGVMQEAVDAALAADQEKLF